MRGRKLRTTAATGPATSLSTEPSTTSPAEPARLTTRQALRRVGVYALLVLVSIITVYPFFWTIISSFTGSGALFEFPPSLWPNAPTLHNYAYVWENVPLARYFLNSIIICVFGVGGSLLVSSLAGYPLAKMRFPGRNIIFSAIIGTLLLPNEAGLIVNYITTIKLGLLQSQVGQYAAVILPSVASAIGIFLMRQAYLSVPDELLDAARIDGAGEWGIWARIMVPLSLPTLAAFGILQFVAFWNSFLWPIIVLTDESIYPLAAGLLNLQGMFASNTRAVSAGTVITMVPIIIVFLFGQRYFMKGLEGAIKG